MDLTLTEFVMLCLLGSSGLVVVLTVVSRTLHARSEARSLTDRVICRLCRHAYEEHGQTRITYCPRCGAANEKGRHRNLG